MHKTYSILLNKTAELTIRIPFPVMQPVIKIAAFFLVATVLLTQVVAQCDLHASPVSTTPGLCLLSAESDRQADLMTSHVQNQCASACRACCQLYPDVKGCYAQCYVDCGKLSYFI
jgi:hypothetical protein